MYECGHMYGMLCRWRSKDGFWESLPFSHMSPGNRTQVLNAFLQQEMLELIWLDSCQSSVTGMREKWPLPSCKENWISDIAVEGLGSGSCGSAGLGAREGSKLWVLARLGGEA